MTAMQYLYPTPFNERALLLSTEISLLESRVLNVPCRIPPQTISTANVGLSPLPLHLHILLRILSHLDLRTLARFRQVSRGLSWIVDTQTPYQPLLRFVPNALQALADTRAIRHFSIRHLESAVRNPLCFFCGALGTLFSLAFGARVCGHCLEHNKAMRVIPRRAVNALFNIDIPRHVLSLLKTVHTVPDQRSSASRALVRLTDVFALIKTYYASETAFAAATERAIAGFSKQLKKDDPSRPRTALQDLDPSLSHLVTVRLPPFSSFSVPHGIRIPYRFCDGCMAEQLEYNAWRRDPEAVNHAAILDAHARRASWAWAPESLNRHVLDCVGCRKLERRQYFFLRGFKAAG